MTFQMKYEIKIDLLPLVKKGRRTGSKINPVKFLVAHDVGNDGLDKKTGKKNGTTARANISYYKDTKEVEASAHGFVDDKEILVCIPLNEKAWHVIYNKPKDNELYGVDANDAAIGVELCYYPEDKARTQKAYEKYVWYLAYLCNVYGLNPLKHITGHHILDPGRKTDPVNALKYHGKSFNNLLNDVQKELIACRQQIEEVSKVSEEIKLTPNQQKDKDVLVRRGYMSKDYKVFSGEMVALITMQAAVVRDLEKSGALK